MRRYTALALASLLILLTACGRPSAVENTQDVQVTLQEADNAQYVSSDGTQSSSEPALTTETASETTAAPTTTKPPVTTTKSPTTTTKAAVTTKNPTSATRAQIDESELAKPPEIGSVPFTAKTVRFYRSYTDGFRPTAAVAQSRDSLRKTLRTFTNQKSPDDDVQNAASSYTDEWFRTHRLIVVALQESSGSTRHNVRSVAYTQSGATVKIERIIPDVGTCDIAQWLIFVELSDTRLSSGDPVEVILS